MTETGNHTRKLSATQGRENVGKQGKHRKTGEIWETYTEKQGKHRQKGRNRGKHRKTEEIWENREKQGKT